MPHLSPDQLDLIADACDFYFAHLARLSVGAPPAEFEHLADTADAVADIADMARDAAEVQ